MIELRLNEVTSKYEVPGPDVYGRVYKVVDLITGEVGYDCTLSDKLGTLSEAVDKIQKYDTFSGWVTDVVSADETRETVQRLNRAPREYISTPHTRLVERVRWRLKDQQAGIISGHDILDDMNEMYLDIMGRHVRPPLDGWGTR